MMTQNDFEFAMTYSFYINKVAPEWARDIDIDTHWRINKGLFSLFDQSNYNDPHQSYLCCVDNFLSNVLNILNIEKQMQNLKTGMLVQLLDGSVVKVIAKGITTDRKNRENEQDLFIVFQGAEDRLEYYSIKGRNNTILNQYLSPKDIVKVINETNTPE